MRTKGLLAVEQIERVFTWVSVVAPRRPPKVLPADILRPITKTCESHDECSINIRCICFSFLLAGRERVKNINSKKA